MVNPFKKMRDFYRKPFVKSVVNTGLLYGGLKVGARLVEDHLGADGLATMVDLVAPLVSGRYAVGCVDEVFDKAPVLRDIARVGVTGAMGLDMVDTLANYDGNVDTFYWLQDKLRGSHEFISENITGGRTEGSTGAFCGAVAGLIERGVHYKNKLARKK